MSQLPMERDWFAAITLRSAPCGRAPVAPQRNASPTIHKKYWTTPSIVAAASRRPNAVPVLIAGALCEGSAFGAAACAGAESLATAVGRADDAPFGYTSVLQSGAEENSGSAHSLKSVRCAAPWCVGFVATPALRTAGPLSVRLNGVALDWSGEVLG